MTRLNIKNIVYLSVLLTFAFHFVSTKFPGLQIWKYSLAALIVFLCINGLNVIYETYFWRSHRWIKMLFIFFGFQEYPNVEGEWTMIFSSSYKFDWERSIYTTTGTGNISIKKTYNGFSYQGKFNLSSFKSRINYLEKDISNKGEWILGYQYINVPDDAKVSTTGFVEHKGFAMLNYDENTPDKIVGFYGNDENRKTRGRIELERVKKSRPKKL